MEKAIADFLWAAVTAPVDIIDYIERRAQMKEIAEQQRQLAERKARFARLIATATMK